MVHTETTVHLHIVYLKTKKKTFCNNIYKGQLISLYKFQVLWDVMCTTALTLPISKKHSAFICRV